MYYEIRFSFVARGWGGWGGGDVEEETRWRVLILEEISRFY
jgi:hypothetical protein